MFFFSSKKKNYQFLRKMVSTYVIRVEIYKIKKYRRTRIEQTVKYFIILLKLNYNKFFIFSYLDANNAHDDTIRYNRKNFGLFFSVYTSLSRFQLTQFSSSLFYIAQTHSCMMLYPLIRAASVYIIYASV